MKSKMMMNKMRGNAAPRKISASQKGFTLIEILIALFIFTIVVTLAYAGLNNVLTAHDITKVQSTKLADSQMGIVFLQRDIQQMVGRAIRSSDKKMPIFSGSTSQIEFTRAGFFNPLSSTSKTSNLLRVAYSGSGGLQRSTWSVLDRVKGSLPHHRLLFKDLSNLKFQFLDEKNKFHDNWPATEPKTEAEPASDSKKSSEKNKPKKRVNLFPKAIQAELQFKTGGKITLLFPVFAHAYKPEKKDSNKNANTNSTNADQESQPEESTHVPQ